MNRGPVIALIAGIFLFGLAATVFLAVFERVEETVETPLSGEARSNDFFALELLYQELGTEARDVIGWNRLPPTDHTLMLLTSYYTVEDLRTRALIDWVDAGGHLVMVPWGAVEVALDHRECDLEEEWQSSEDFESDDFGLEEEAQSTEERHTIEQELAEFGYLEGDDEGSVAFNDEDGDLIDEPTFDPLAEAFGIEVEIPKHSDWEQRFDCYDDEEEIELEEGANDCTQRLVAVTTENGSFDILLLPSPGLRTEPDADFESLVRVPYGDGLVTALTQGDFLRNELIGEHDHAALAWELVETPERSSAGIWIVGRDRYPGLLEVLREHAWRILASGLVLLLVALWWKGVRFGPPVADQLPERRSVLEHISASADFLWRSQLGSVLLDSTRRAALARVERRDPSFTQLGENERVERLSQATGMSRGELLRALSDRGAEDPTEFTRTVRSLERLRKKL